MINKAVLYSDGACSPNPGIGGWGAIYKEGGISIRFTDAYKLTTNNRMELLGIIEPLETIMNEENESLSIKIVTDSQYVANAINKGWLKNWIKNGWKKSDGKYVLNIDLWKRMIFLLRHFNLTFEWIRGHNGHQENEECDLLAVHSRSFRQLKIDQEYENGDNKRGY